MKYCVIQSTYCAGNLGPYSGPSCGHFEHKVVAIKNTREEAKKYCEEKFNNIGCEIQEVSE